MYSRYSVSLPNAPTFLSPRRYRDENLIALYASTMSIRMIAEYLGVTVYTVYRRVKLLQNRGVITETLEARKIRCKPAAPVKEPLRVRWQEEEVTELRYYYRRNCTVEEIALMMETDVMRVYNKVSKLERFHGWKK